MNKASSQSWVASTAAKVHKAVLGKWVKSESQAVPNEQPPNLLQWEMPFETAEQNDSNVASTRVMQGDRTQGGAERRLEPYASVSFMLDMDGSEMTISDMPEMAESRCMNVHTTGKVSGQSDVEEEMLEQDTPPSQSGSSWSAAQ